MAKREAVYETCVNCKGKKTVKVPLLNIVIPCPICHGKGELKSGKWWN